MAIRALIRRLLVKSPATDEAHKALMKQTWNDYAQKNAAFYIATEGKPLNEAFEWDMKTFFSQGRSELVEKLDEFGISRNWLRDKTVIEIGCGIGRQTRAWTGLAARVIAFDISDEMLKQAQSNLKDCSNLTLFKGDGANLAQVESSSVDFVYSFVVFQHITDKRLTKSYFADTGRVLRRGGHFLFQVRDYGMAKSSADVWNGSDVSEEDIRAWAAELGFMVERVIGQKTHYLWALLTRL